MTHYRVSLVLKDRSGTHVLKVEHKRNPRLATGMHRALVDHAKFVTVRVCWLGDDECTFTKVDDDGVPVPAPSIDPVG